MEQTASEQSKPQRKRSLRGLASDPQFFLALLAGLVVVWGISLFMAPTALPAEELVLRYLRLLLIFPVLEEIVFRGMLQEMIAKRRGGTFGPLSHANLITSLLFASAHLYSHPAAWAISTFFPSLVFGYFRDRYQHVLPAVLLHVSYNAVFFLFPSL